MKQKAQRKILMRQKIRKVIAGLSLILFPMTFYYFSPVIPLQGAVAGIVTGSVIVFLFLFVFSIFMGRVFCSWICPAGAVQDLTAESRQSPFPRKYGHLIKYLVWLPWLVMLLAMYRRAGGLQSVNFFYATRLGLSTTDLMAAIVYTIVVLTFFSLSLLFGRRAACHSICWISPFMILGKYVSKSLRTFAPIPSLHLQTRPESCVSCGRCEAACPMSLQVQKLVEKKYIDHSDCILCGNCVDVCGKKTISFAWFRGGD
jgi:ferredoxin-type protein NapH